MWRALRHPSVLPLVGAVMTETELSIVSEWMPNGTLGWFLKDHPRENLSKIHDAGAVVFID